MADDALEQEVERLREQVARLQRRVSILSAAGDGHPGFRLFALDGSRDFGSKVAKALNMRLSPHVERFHPDRECYVRPRHNVRRSHVYVITSLYSDEHQSVNDKLMKLYTFIGAAVDASAAEVVAVIPYLGYARSDRKVQSREPVITKYIAEHLRSIGCRRVLTIDVHNLGAFQNAHRHPCLGDNLECRVEFAPYLAREELHDTEPSDITVLSPDGGGMERSRHFRRSLEKQMDQGIGLCFFDKQHSGDKITGHQIVGDVRPVTIVLDDMIASGRTTRLCIDAAHAAGSERIYVVATHGLFVGDVNKNLDSEHLTKLVISDTIEPFRLSEAILEKTAIVSTTTTFAEAIRRTYTGESLSDLFT